MSTYTTQLKVCCAMFPRLGDRLALVLARAMRHVPASLPKPRFTREHSFHVRGMQEPVIIRPMTADFHIAREMFYRHEYEHMLESAGISIDPAFILDLGSNIGLSCRVWQRLFPEASIVAVEADASNAELCRRNVALGPAPAKVVVRHAAAAAESGALWLEQRQSPCSHRTRTIEPGQQTGGVRVDAVSVPDLLAQVGHVGPIDLLKCDIEGGEVSLFASCAPWVGRVRVMCVETHDHYTLSDLADDLQRNGGRFRPAYASGQGSGRELGVFVSEAPL